MKRNRKLRMVSESEVRGELGDRYVNIKKEKWKDRRNSK